MAERPTHGERDHSGANDDWHRLTADRDDWTIGSGIAPSLASRVDGDDVHPMIDHAESDRIRVTVTVTDDESVERLIDCVDDVVDARTVGDRASDPQGRPESLRIDVRELTPKQWDALELAGERGYFDRPRRVNLEALAAELSISKSAVSQRLGAAESTLIRAVLEAAREPEPTEQ